MWLPCYSIKRRKPKPVEKLCSDPAMNQEIQVVDPVEMVFQGLVGVYGEVS